MKSEGGGRLRTSHDPHDVPELTDRLVLMAGGRVESVRKTRQATAGDVLAMIILGQPECTSSAAIVRSWP